MKTLVIEWKHLDINGETCNRCYDTGENLVQEVKRLKRVLEPKGITIELKETKLDDTMIRQSNALLFNGKPMEELLEIDVKENYCESCTALLGIETHCRTIIFEGNEYEDVPAKAIRKATYKVLGLEEGEKEQLGHSRCSCGQSNKTCC